MSDLKVIPKTMRINGQQAIVESDTTLVPARSLDAIAATVRHEHDLVIKAGQKMLEHAVLCGGALLEARRVVKQGTWLKWLDENAAFSQGTAALYMRMAFHASLLVDAGVDSVTGAMEFLREHNLQRISMLSDERVGEIRRLHQEGLGARRIARITGESQSTVRKYISDRDRGTRRRRKTAAPLRPGRRSRNAKLAIADDMVEGAAIKLREMFGPGSGNVTDSDRDAAVEVLRAAFTYDGPIPGEKP